MSVPTARITKFAWIYCLGALLESSGTLTLGSATHLGLLLSAMEDLPSKTKHRIQALPLLIFIMSD